MGKLQNEDFKSEAELLAASPAGTKAQLLNDTKVYVTANSINKRLDEAITDGDIGGGSGGGGSLNFYPFSDADNSDVSNWNTGNAASFDGGTSGTLQGAFSLSTTAADLIFGTTVHKLVLNATPGNSDDDQIGTDGFEIPQGYRGRHLGFVSQYSYDGADGDISLRILGSTDGGSTYAEDLGTFPLDAYSPVDNNAAQFGASFFVPSDVDFILFGFFVNTHASGSEVLLFDKVEVTPDLIKTADLSNITDFEEFSLSLNGTPPTVNSKSFTRVVGDTREIHSIMQVTATSGVSGTFGLVLPFSEEIDFDKIDPAGTFNAPTVGEVMIRRGGNTYTAKAVVNLGVSSTFVYVLDPPSGIYISTVNNTDPQVNDVIAFKISLPIKGRSAKSTNILTANQSILPTKYNSNAGQTVANGSIVRLDFEDVVFDPHSLVTTGGTWGYEIPEDGYYKVGAARRWEATTADFGTTLFLYLDDTAVSRLWINTPKDMDATNNNIFIGGSDVIYGNKGQVINLRVSQSSGGNLSFTTNPLENYVTITKEDVKPLSAISVPQTARVYDEKSAGTNGGTFTNGAWRTRDLNQSEGGEGWLSLGTNEFTLQPGSYFVKISAPCYLVANNVARLRDSSDTTTYIQGQSSRSNVDADVNALVVGRVSITSPETFIVQHQGTLTQATNGFGNGNSLGGTSIFTTVEITKER